MTDQDDLAQLQSLLEASERTRQRELVYSEKMSKINAQSPDNQYWEKLRWLATNGKAGEMKEMIEARKL